MTPGSAPSSRVADQLSEWLSTTIGSWNPPPLTCWLGRRVTKAQLPFTSQSLGWTAALLIGIWWDCSVGTEWDLRALRGTLEQGVTTVCSESRQPCPSLLPSFPSPPSPSQTDRSQASLGGDLLSPQTLLGHFSQVLLPSWNLPWRMVADKFTPLRTKGEATPHPSSVYFSRLGCFSLA
jgi:hypothetical protein